MFDRNYEPDPKGKLVKDIFFTINQEPSELHDRRKLTDGKIYERHFVKPKIIGASQENPLYGMSGNGTTTIIYRGDSIKDAITPDKIVYQYAVGEYANEQGDVIYRRSTFLMIAEIACLSLASMHRPSSQCFT